MYNKKPSLQYRLYEKNCDKIDEKNELAVYFLEYE